MSTGPRHALPDPDASTTGTTSDTSGDDSGTGSSVAGAAGATVVLPAPGPTAEGSPARLAPRANPHQGQATTGDAIEVQHLRVVRGKRLVLPDVSLRVPTGQVVGLLGPSGGGKSTLIRAIVGVQVVAGGSITVLGEPAGTAALRRRVGYVTQAPSIYSDLTVRQNVAYFGAILGAPTTDVDWALGQVDLVDHADALVSTLSGGQRSRASLASALVGRPEVLVLDEPTVGLDPVLRRSLWTLFHHLADSGTTLLVSSHVMDEAARCDRLLLLRDGRILADETLPELLDRTGTEDAEAAFLALIDAEDTHVDASGAGARNRVA